MKRFYFTDEQGNDDFMNDHIGTIKGAITKAQKYANKNKINIAINDFSNENIIDWVYYEETL